LLSSPLICASRPLIWSGRPADVLHERVPGGQGLCGPVAVGRELPIHRSMIEFIRGA
jgi:hypothetical protein